MSSSRVPEEPRWDMLYGQYRQSLQAGKPDVALCAEAFTDFVVEHEAWIKRWFGKQGVPASDLDEEYQKSAIALHRVMRQGSPEGPLEPYCRAMLAKRLVSWIRAKSRASKLVPPEEGQEPPAPGLSLEDLVLRRHDREPRWHRVFEYLQRRYPKTPWRVWSFMMHVDDERRPWSDIANQLKVRFDQDISAAVLANWYHRDMKYVRRDLGDELGRTRDG